MLSTHRNDNDKFEIEVQYTSNDVFISRASNIEGNAICNFPIGRQLCFRAFLGCVRTVFNVYYSFDHLKFVRVKLIHGEMFEISLALQLLFSRKLFKWRAFEWGIVMLTRMKFCIKGSTAKASLVTVQYHSQETLTSTTEKKKHEANLIFYTFADSRLWRGEVLLCIFFVQILFFCFAQQ